MRYEDIRKKYTRHGGLLKRNFEYETKSKIQMERGRSNGKTCLLLMARWFAIQNTNWIFRGFNILQ